MRFAIAGISHETNTYCHEYTRKDAFHELRGDAFFKASGQDTSIGGVLSACDNLAITPVPILFAWAQPSGMITLDTYSAFKQEIVTGLTREKPLDAVILLLHGAGVVETIDDLEADLALAVRKTVGDDVPITASFDLHGNVTQTMADALDGVFACHNYPHTDMHTRAAESVQLAHRLVKEKFRPCIHVESLPLLLPTTTTFFGPGQDTLELMLDAESIPGIIDVSWFHGFPYTDVPHVGSQVVVTSEMDRGLAASTAKALASELWNARESFRPTSLSVSQAIDLALAGEVTPVVINETSDNCGGGAPGDGTHLLREMLNRRLENACFGFMVDPEVAAQAHAAGVGSTIHVQLGGKYDELHGEPLEFNAYIKSLHDGRLTMRAMNRGSPLNLGPMARLVVQNIDIIVASVRSQTFDIEPFLALGIDVTRYQIVALKSSQHFRAGFEHIAGSIVTADPPGLTTLHIEVFERTRSNGKLWPLDDF